MPSGPVVSMTGEVGPDVIVGTIASFNGQYKNHPKYGTSFRVASYDIEHDEEQVSSFCLFIDFIAPNVGAVRAKALVDYFGEEFIDVLDNWPNRLEEVPGIGKITADSLRDAWTANRDQWEISRQEFTLRAFLYGLGIKERRVKKILAFFGGGLRAESSIRENPYVLAEVDGFGFSTADHVANKLGMPMDSSARVRAFIHYTLAETCTSNGHLFFTVSEIAILANAYCGDNATQFLGLPKVEITDLAPLIDEMVKEGRITQDGDALYNTAQYALELRSAQLLAGMMTKNSDLVMLNRTAVDKFISEFEVVNGITLSEEQRRAMHYFVTKKVLIVTGSPGTGKTLITKALVGLCVKMKLNFVCMTPTGISAKKMATTIGHEASTIHRRLMYRGDSWGYGEENQFEADVVFIDESSMVDQDVFYHLVASLRDRTHLVLIGDDYQLPSVGAGNVLRDLINCQAVPTVRLETIFRQNEASDIIRVAHKIKKGDPDLSLFKPDPTADVFFYRETNIQKLEAFIVKIAQKFKDERRIFQIITPRNEGPLSVASLNKTLQEVLNPPAEGVDEMAFREGIMRRGDRIMVKKNDYDNGIYNGDVGKVLRMGGGGNITILVDDREITLPIEGLDEKLKLAYAITVHGAQGQEYPYVILPFINQHGKNLLQRNLLYTAITRAKKKVIAIGHGSAIERAINNASVSRRNTKLGYRVRSLLGEPLEVNPEDFAPKEQITPTVEAPQEVACPEAVSPPVKKGRSSSRPKRSSKPPQDPLDEQLSLLMEHGLLPTESQFK
jgi:exodeoxyribonuclease V alpha subunit